MLAALAAAACADVFLHNPRGSNNRLDEGGGVRANDRRLFDSQNDPKGGYGFGGSAADKAEPLKYVAGSELSVELSTSHGCGVRDAACVIVVQYMCNPGATTPPGLPTDTTNANTGVSTAEGPVRDGTVSDTPDPNNADANSGLHEPASFANDCLDRERNKGLDAMGQSVSNSRGAMATRQNPTGDRYGNECSEEASYHPYWHPSPWKDVAIITNAVSVCDYYKTESQNVKAKNYCTISAYNNAADCAASNWKE